MIFLNKDNFSEEDFALLEKDKQFLISNIAVHKKKKEFILNVMQKVADSTLTAETDCVTHMLSILQNLKKSLQLCNENLSALDICINNIDNFIFSIQNNSHDLETIVKTFNADYSELYKTTIENSLNIETCLCEISATESSAFESAVSESLEPVSIEDSSNNESSEKTVVVSENPEPSSTEDFSSKESAESTLDDSKTTSQAFSEDFSEKKYIENTLTISEALGKVTLPYSISEIKEILEKHPNKYSSIDNVICTKYTLPISMFKNASIARFKEGYKLIKNREQGSIADSFELGLELMFNYNLHPAIIAACKNLDELDIYLDYLSSGETNKFNCFKIIFDLPPAISKHKKKGENLL